MPDAPITSRRSFFKTLAMAAAGFSILPAATTYARSWKFQTKECLHVPNPEYRIAEYEVSFLIGPNAYTTLADSANVGFTVMLRDKNGIWFEQVADKGYPIRYRREGDTMIAIAPFKKIG